MGRPSSQYRAGYNTCFGLIASQFTKHQVLGTGADTAANQPWLLNQGAGEGNNALGPDMTCAEQLANSDDILVTEMPNGFMRSNRIKKVNMEVNYFVLSLSLNIFLLELNLTLAVSLLQATESMLLRPLSKVTTLLSINLSL